jgi:hypothetical protein
MIRGRRLASPSAIAAALLLGAALLSGCSTRVGELPFPAVHDMPPARTNTTLSDDEQRKAEQDLLSARDSTEARAQENAKRGGGQQANTGTTGGQQTGGSHSP